MLNMLLANIYSGSADAYRRSGAVPEAVVAAGDAQQIYESRYRADPLLQACFAPG
jgi:hypothetical protein